MDEMQTPQEEGPGADEVIIELLTELVQQGRAKRAEGVMAPPPPEVPPMGGDEAEMAELEQMLGEAPAEEMAEGEMPPPKKPEDEDELE
jgi:hypothetical protein